MLRHLRRGLTALNTDTAALVDNSHTAVAVTNAASAHRAAANAVEDLAMETTKVVTEVGILVVAILVWYLSGRIIDDVLGDA